MKQLFLFTTILLVLVTACNKLKDEKLTDNPYDKDYEGPKVITINNISTTAIDSTHHRNSINVINTAKYYDNILLYRNGVKMMNSRSNNTLYDNTPTIGITYSYQVQLTYQSAATPLSDAVNYKTQ